MPPMNDGKKGNAPIIMQGQTDSGDYGSDIKAKDRAGTPTPLKP